MKLARKVRAVLVRDDDGEGPVGLAATKLGTGPHSARDNDIHAWAITYGIAWGVARTEDPFESDEEVSKRAMKAAWPVFIELNGGSIAGVGSE